MGEKSAMPNWSASSCLQGTRFSTISWRCDLEASLEFDGAVVLAVTSTVDLVPNGIPSLRLVPPLGRLLFFVALRPAFDVPGFFLPLALLVLMYGGNWDVEALAVNAGVLDIDFCRADALAGPAAGCQFTLFSFCTD